MKITFLLMYSKLWDEYNVSCYHYGTCNVIKRRTLSYRQLRKLCEVNEAGIYFAPKPKNLFPVLHVMAINSKVKDHTDVCGPCLMRFQASSEEEGEKHVRKWYEEKHWQP